jgi:hypothetical protein
MKWRPRISIPLGKGIRINIGKRGIGGSAGIPGIARIGIGSDGRTRSTVGKGIFRWEQQGGRPKGCGCGGCLIILIIGLLIAAIISAILPNPNRVVPLAVPTAPIGQAPKIPLFLEPTKAANLPLELGLKDTAQGRAPWRQSDDRWYALASIVTHTGKLTKVGDVDNDITCLHESTTPSHVTQVTWTANVFNPEGQTATLPKFRELCLKYTSRLGCPIPPELFQNVDPAKGQQLETSQARFLIEKLAYNRGHGWRFRIMAK